MHHDEVVVLPSGSSPYLRKDKRGKNSIRTDSNKIEHQAVNPGEEAYVSLELKPKKMSRAK